ncbi:hypothetical protein NLG97_g9044 [Lecanicillium saksenae]|uniref:Uncharacterized protein n=1 Tax=Lecanicillium saksenae TaxID=468837 RepID=A0ACC1QK52_9HYPO|nr:hypothetical protein NLG97_g9044 [Lecanicillium saksenae]
MSPLQKKLQADRQLRRRLAEGKLSWEEQLEAAAAIEGIDLQSITAGDQPELGAAEAGSSRYEASEGNGSTGQDNPGAEWSLLKRRQRTAEPELEAENLRELDSGHSKQPEAEHWPLLKRKEASYGYMIPTDDSVDHTKELVAETQKALAKNENSIIERSHIMLKIDGLSTNVNPSDFYRIAQNDLSKWNQSIRKTSARQDDV